MINGPHDQDEGRDLAPEVSTPLVFGYEAHSKVLTDTQQTVMELYFDQHFYENFLQFIYVAPEALQPLRQLIISYAPILTCNSFVNFVNQFYPTVPQTENTSSQNLYFRQLLISFNELCNNKVDINHPLYDAIFDVRLSPSKSNSPTKRKLVTGFFTKKINEHFTFPKEDPFVCKAIAWLTDINAQYNQQVSQHASSSQTDCTARKKLFFG